MDVNKCHLCKSDRLLDAGTYDMTAGTVTDMFEGTFSLTVHAAQLTKGSEASPVEPQGKFSDIPPISTRFFIKYKPANNNEV